jgi:hypothetical protein
MRNSSHADAQAASLPTVDGVEPGARPKKMRSQSRIAVDF